MEWKCERNDAATSILDQRELSNTFDYFGKENSNHKDFYRAYRVFKFWFV